MTCHSAEVNRRRNTRSMPMPSLSLWQEYRGTRKKRDPRSSRLASAVGSPTEPARAVRQDCS